MGWLWNDSTSSGSKAKDPFHRLDPEIREYLLRESPLKLAPTSSTSSTSQTSVNPKTPETDSSEESKPTATPSKYGDRYADIWAQYQPQGAEEAAKSSQEQLSDIIQAYKWRKGAIGRAALENCANEQFELHECYKRGSFKERMTTCSKYNHKLQDCYTAQSVCAASFLIALFEAFALELRMLKFSE